MDERELRTLSRIGDCRGDEDDDMRWQENWQELGAGEEM